MTAASKSKAPIEVVAGAGIAVVEELAPNSRLIWTVSATGVGPSGLDGEDGEDGLDGPPGAPGAPGAAGSAGAAGVIGVPGFDGCDGLDCFDGAPGQAGAQGTTGVTGAQGTIGPAGWDGLDGDEGFPGIPGPPGSSGAPGAAGAEGANGSPGLDGFDGLDGELGFPGQPGPKGADGAPGGGFTWEAVVKQAADVSNAAASFVNTDLVFTFVANGVYVIDLFLMCTSVAATTGYRFAFDTSVAVTTVGLTFVHQLANTGTLSGGSSIADATATGLSSGVPTAGALVPIIGTGILVVGATGGTCRLVFGPEVAASATFKANSIMRVHKVA